MTTQDRQRAEAVSRIRTLVDELGLKETLDILDAVSVLNRDNGKRFKDTSRLDTISSLLWDSKYRRVNADGLFNCYAQRPASELRGQEVVVVSSHVDCERSITRCFSSRQGNGLLLGTYDNSITNAAILTLMLDGSLPEDVVVAFTGDEEEGSKGAKHLVRFLRSIDARVSHLFVMDVTDMGWEEGADLTVENNFWHDDRGQRIVEVAESLPFEWRFVPSDLDDIPAFVPAHRVIPQEAEEDESWYYDEEGINCCSLCLPVRGEMHGDAGVLAREASLRRYVDALRAMLVR